MRKLTTALFVLAVAASAALSAFAADVPPPCAPVPVQKAVKVERREIAVSIIGKGLLSRAKCRSAEEMIAYWTAAMDEEIGNKPDLVVLPEICDVLQGVSPQEKADWLRRRGNRVLEAFAAYAKRHRCYLVYPTYRQLPDGAWANCAIVIDRDGDVVGVYDKYQPTVRDLGNPVLDVRPGTGTCVVETDFGRLGVMICFDLNFQPIQDLYAKENVDVLAFPSYYDGGHNRHTWAARCQAYVVAATVGSLDKTVVGPAGDELFRAVSPAAGTRASIFANSRRCASENTKSRYTLPSAGWANALSTLPAQRVSIVPNGVCTVTAPYFSARRVRTAATAFTTRRACGSVPWLPFSSISLANSSASTVRFAAIETRTGAFPAVSVSLP